MSLFNFNEITISSKKELNQIVSDEDIYQHYYGDYEIDNYNISPRGEEYPSMYIDYYQGKLMWRDFGYDPRPRDAVDFVIFIKSLEGVKLNFYQAINLIIKEVKPGTGKKVKYKPVKKKPQTAVRFRKKYHQWELDYWKKYNVSEKILKKFQVFPAKVYCNGMLWHKSQKNDPCFVYLWDINNEIWKAYRPKAPYKEIKNKKIKQKFFANNIKGHVQGLDHLPKTGKICFVTKSYKDVMVLYSMGIPSIAPHSESYFISPGLVANLKKRFKHVYINYDNDRRKNKSRINRS